jgi:hypothetical protein
MRYTAASSSSGFRRPARGAASACARIATLVLLGCDGGGATGTDAGDVEDAVADAADDGAAGDPWTVPDPEGRVTEGNRIDAEPEMWIVTSEALRPSWEPYAAQRTLRGVSTRVVTVEALAAAHPAVDEAASLREAFRAAHEGGALRYVLLGGDADQVPFRRVEARVSVPLGDTYTTRGPAELYFADLDTDWDADGDGVWGEHRQDLSAAAMRAPEIAVGRVPAGTPDEVRDYRTKVDRYEARGAAGRGSSPLLLSDVASSTTLGDIDSAEAIEVTLAEVFPEPFRAEARRLYATAAAATRYGGVVLTPRGVAGALQEGFPLAFHEGHGTFDLLTEALDVRWLRGLDNEVPPVLASCACLAGNFADRAESGNADDWAPQAAGEDAAGELWVILPRGGVAYAGNTAIGLGPLGGAQFLHAMFAGWFAEGEVRLGDAFNAGHAGVRDVSLRISGFTMVMTDDTEYWTHLGVILLGDPALPVWTDRGEVPEIVAPTTYGPGWNEIEVVVRNAEGPWAGAVVTAVKDRDFELRVRTDDAGRAVLRFLPYGPAPIRIGVSGRNAGAAFATIAPAG